MSDLIDEFVKELMETGSTGDRNPDLPKKMLKRTPGQWSWHYVPDKGKAIFVEDGSGDISDIHPTEGDMQLMTYSPEMYKFVCKYADVDPEARDLIRRINVEPPAGYEKLKAANY